MNKIWISIAICITIVIVTGILFVKQNPKQSKQLISPNLTFPSLPKPTPTPSLSPSSTPKTFKFDSSTDLKKELEEVNPQVVDSDFN